MICLTVFQVGLDGVDLATLSPQDWFFHAGTALYGYGFGAPFVLGGPLGDSDPGCGTAELHDVLVTISADLITISFPIPDFLP